MTHLYVSTYCQHEQHSDCMPNCNVCKAPCLCPCHKALSLVVAMLAVACGCHDYGGGYSDQHDVEVYHHGIETVAQALRAYVKDPQALQVRVLESVGKDASSSNPYNFE